MIRDMKMMLSEFIKKLEVFGNDGNHPKTANLIVLLKQSLQEKGDIELNIDDLCKHLGVEI